MELYNMDKNPVSAIQIDVKPWTNYLILCPPHFSFVKYE